MERRVSDRQKINDVWCKMVDVRNRVAAQAGFGSYREYRWKELFRFDYTPEDCFKFHQAIEQVAVPAASRMYEKRRKQMNLASLRPWDLWVDSLGREPLKPFSTIDELVGTVTLIFHKVDPQLGEYFKRMHDQGLLDLENRKDKAPGAYCIDFDMVMLPFIFENAVGLHTDVSTLIHESGHAFHVFEEAALPYYHQIGVGMEIAEIASTAMELLASRYLIASEGGFYTESQAARALTEHLEEAVLFWPYMAVVDTFQHWAYSHPEEAMKPSNCDRKWAELWPRYMPGVDWSGLEVELVTGWQRKQHIFEAPFYYIEYGMAYLGAFQIWANSMKDEKSAIASYRQALRLGGTLPLPELYAAAGARFKFDAETLQEAIELIEGQIGRMSNV
jgi:oligoendopeptidase F